MKYPTPTFYIKYIAKILSEAAVLADVSLDEEQAMAMSQYLCDATAPDDSVNSGSNYSVDMTDPLR